MSWLIGFDPFDFMPWWSLLAMLIVTIVASAAMTLLLLTKYRSAWDTESHKEACIYKNFLFPWSGASLVIGIFLLVWGSPQGSDGAENFLAQVGMTLIPLMQAIALIAYTRSNHQHK